MNRARRSADLLMFTIDWDGRADLLPSSCAVTGFMGWPDARGEGRLIEAFRTAAGERQAVIGGDLPARNNGRMSITRLVTVADAPTLAEVLRVDREFLAPWEPVRDDDYFTTAGQRAVIRADLQQHVLGSKLPHAILDESGGLIGRITLSDIQRGPFQSCSLGYWVRASHNGRGFATKAVREMVRVAFEELGLHRVQAAVLLHNVGSHRVLDRNGFMRFGMAPEYLHIAGRWQDHAMYQVVRAS